MVLLRNARKLKVRQSRANPWLPTSPPKAPGTQNRAMTQTSRCRPCMQSVCPDLAGSAWKLLPQSLQHLTPASPQLSHSSSSNTPSPVPPCLLLAGCFPKRAERSEISFPLPAIAEISGKEDITSASCRSSLFPLN